MRNLKREGRKRRKGFHTHLNMTEGSSLSSREEPGEAECEEGMER